MALAAATTWEVRTTGNDSNGGGFVAGASGTDFSQQNAAQYTFANLASTNANTASPTVTSASHNFVAADVGNIMQITAGPNWTAGFYQIVSVAANAATLDRACGSVASVSSGTFAVGGALATLTKLIGSALVAKNTAYIKAGTYTISSQLTLPDASFELVTPTTLTGYSTSRGDGGRPTIQTSSGSTSYVRDGSNTGWCIQNIIFDGNSIADQALQCSGQMGKIKNCKFIGGTTFGLRVSGSYVLVLDCEATANTAVTGLHCDGAAVLINCVSHDNNAIGIVTDVHGTALYCLSYNNTGAGHHGFVNNNAADAKFIGCLSYNNAGDGFNVTPNGSLTTLNNVSYGNGGYGFNWASNEVQQYFDFNAYGSNTSGNLHTVSAGTHDVALTASPFVNAPTDFSPNNTAGGGAAIRSVGFPGTLLLGGTGYNDIGPLRHQDPAGGGVSIFPIFD
jgi:hypothetical protein